MYPTVVALAGLPPPPKTWELPGSDLTLGMQRGNVVKPIDAAFGQITRCVNCSLAYGTAVGIRGAYRKPFERHRICQARLWTSSFTYESHSACLLIGC